MDPQRRRTLLIGLGVFAVALLVRLFGIGWGLPNDQRYQSLHPDEPVVFLYSQEIEPAKLDFAPGFYNYGTLYLTVLRVTTDMAEAYGAGPADESEKAAWQAVGRYHLAGRSVSALAGAATAWLVFLIVLPRIGQSGALFASAVMALAPGHVVHSRFQTVDVLAAFFLVASLYFTLRIVQNQDERPPDRDYVRLALLAGVMAGLSAGTKYTGVLALVALFAVVVIDRRAIAWKSFFLSVAACGLVFVLAVPGVFVETQAFVRDFKYEMTHTQQGHGLVFAGTANGFLFHLQNLMACMGGMVTVVGIAGLLRGAWRRHSWLIALLAFAVAYYVLIGRAEVKFLRYVFPLVPVLAISFGWLVSRALKGIHDGVRGALLVGASLTMVLGILGVATAAKLTAQYTSWMVAPDVRDAVATEIKEESGQQTTVGLATDPWFYTPSLYPQTATGPWVRAEQRFEWMDATSGPRVLRYRPEGEERIDWDRRLLTELEPDFVVFSGFEIGDLNRLNKLPSPPSEFKLQLGRAEEFMDTLLTRYELWKVRGEDGGSLPHDLMYVRPEIQVWKKKTDSQGTSNGSSTTSQPSEEPASTP